jgi:hypothetical protein
MFILFGSPRSGTTLLKEMICQHPLIKIPYETDFIIPMAFILDRVQVESIGKKLIEDMICSTKDFEPSLGKFLDRSEVCKIVATSQYSLFGMLDGLYSAIARKTGAITAGDKSPNDLGFISILKKTGLFESNIKIIHIIRDVRDVILSLKKTGWAPADVEHYFPRIWANSNLDLRRFASQGKNPYLLVRYEDLVIDPYSELQKIFALLDVESNSFTYDFSKLGKELSHLPHHQNLGKEMLQDRRFAWRQDSNSSILSLCKENAGSALLEFCYENK